MYCCDVDGSVLSSCLMAAAAAAFDRLRLASDSQGLGAPGCRYETCLRRASLLRDTCEQTLHAYLFVNNGIKE